MAGMDNWLMRVVGGVEAREDGLLLHKTIKQKHVLEGVLSPQNWSWADRTPDLHLQHWALVSVRPTPGLLSPRSPTNVILGSSGHSDNRHTLVSSLRWYATCCSWESKSLILTWLPHFRDSLELLYLSHRSCWFLCSLVLWLQLPWAPPSPPWTSYQGLLLLHLLLSQSHCWYGNGSRLCSHSPWDCHPTPLNSVLFQPTLSSVLSQTRLLKCSLDIISTTPLENLADPRGPCQRVLKDT